MSRLQPIDPATAQGKAKTLLDAVKSRLGVTPNMMRTMAQSPSVYLAFGNTLGTGSLGAKLREQIALAVAETNACEYCLSAHTLLGKRAG